MLPRGETTIAEGHVVASTIYNWSGSFWGRISRRRGGVYSTLLIPQPKNLRISFGRYCNSKPVGRPVSKYYSLFTHETQVIVILIGLDEYHDVSVFHSF